MTKMEKSQNVGTKSAFTLLNKQVLQINVLLITSNSIRKMLKILQILLHNFYLFNYFIQDKNYTCGGAKPGPMWWAQIQRFTNNMSEERKSYGNLVINSRTRKYPGMMIREEYPPRVWHMSVKGALASPQSTFQEVPEVKIDYQCTWKG